MLAGAGLVAYGQPITIVLDDLHAVGSERSLRSLAHAIERLPANARVLASTRSDPAMSLARLRARGGAGGDSRASWLALHNNAVMAVLFLVFAAKLIADGLPPLGRLPRRHGR